ncbi:MAG: PIG-L family deacetylase [Candidatus Levybacteria bacterium]|nr:PIG-L family deacetylase [Candidatus Levybacteria bacterium]
MKKVMGIFAHPDDEALGPAGTLATFAKDNDVYLICVTSGEAAGKTKEEKLLIGEIRRNELLRSAKILGIKDVFFLGYEDGELKNNIYHQLADDIAKKIEEIRPEILLTFDLKGVSGHIDHITVSFVTTFVFKKYSFIKKLMYYVTTKAKSDRMQDYFIHFPKGYERQEVDEVISVENVWETKVKAMHCHVSQMKDVESVLKGAKDSPKEEYFLIDEKL